MLNIYKLVVGSLFLPVGIHAFSVPPKGIATKTTTNAAKGCQPRETIVMMGSVKNYPHQEFHRAIDCATEPGLCEVEELMKLADDLERHGEECFFEKEEDTAACEKEKDDRLDVASLLRLEAEVLLREDYLDNANLFKENVDQARLKESWSEHQEELDMYSNY